MANNFFRFFNYRGYQFSINDNNLIKKYSSGRRFLRKYEIGGFIASGGNGVVCKGRNIRTNKIVAIKHSGFDAVYQKGIPNEIKAHKLAMKAVKKTAHKENWYVYDDYFVMVMEYIEEDYKEMFYYIKQYVMFKEDVVKKLFKKIYEVIHHLNKKGVYHLDIKVENIMMRTTNEGIDFKLIDFGHSYSKKFGNDSWKVMSGTEGYRSPGLIWKSSYKLADVWALVQSTYYLVEGKRMFENDREVLNKTTPDPLVVKTSIGSADFAKFVSSVLNEIVYGTLSHIDLMAKHWLKVED